jgi:hypothetical protein
VCFKIMLELPRAYYNRIANLFHFRINFLDTVRTSNTKYTGNCCFIVLSLCLISFLTTKALLNAECMAETYKMRVAPVQDLTVLANAQGSDLDHQKFVVALLPSLTLRSHAIC